MICLRATLAFNRLINKAKPNVWYRLKYQSSHINISKAKSLVLLSISCYYQMVVSVVTSCYCYRYCDSGKRTSMTNTWSNSYLNPLSANRTMCLTILWNWRLMGWTYLLQTWKYSCKQRYYIGTLTTIMQTNIFIYKSVS